ncbi:HAMP domain-containing protein [Paenibacillus sp. OAS669]|uniref:HAMP domain-containing protein n=1 Tax=Paenibacillus sp. OAS669 TaxID=2663821 RepID=UPI001CEF51DA
MSRAITRPLKQLKHNMRRVEGGNFSAAVEVSSGDEIGRLRTSLRNRKRTAQNRHLRGSFSIV